MAKFKVGDRVNRTDGSLFGHYAAIKNPCTVTEIIDDHGEEFVHVVDSTGQRFNGGYSSRYELVARFLVAYSEPGDETFATQEDAEANAAALAIKEPGSKFAVLRVVATVEASASVVVTERAA